MWNSSTCKDARDFTARPIITIIITIVVVILSCYRYAIPAETLWCFEASSHGETSMLLRLRSPARHLGHLYQCEKMEHNCSRQIKSRQDPIHTWDCFEFAYICSRVPPLRCAVLASTHYILWTMGSPLYSLYIRNHKLPPSLLHILLTIPRESCCLSQIII